MQNVKLSIVIPVYNEINTILELVRQVQDEKHPKEIIIVDDNSQDGTRELLQQLRADNIKVLYNPVNRGKGYCLRQGFQQATGDIVIIQDADLEYYPDEYGILISKIVEGKADVVYGSRFLGAHRAFHFYHYVGNTVLNLIANIALNTNLTDLMTCYKAFRTPLIKSLVLKADRFGIEPEITAEIFKSGYKVYEVPISYNGRSYDEGKKIKWTDFFACLYWLFRSVFRGIDVGKDTLLRMTLMKNNNKWTYSKIQPYLGKKILELGSGIGTFSKFLVGRGREVTLTDINPEYVNHLQSRFTSNPAVKVLNADAQKINELVGEARFDTAVAINMLEHVENDGQLIGNLKKILLKNGRLIIIVPAHKWLYGMFDKNLKHYRRYEKEPLQDLLEREGFDVEKIEFMNALSALGWFFHFRVLGKKRIPASSAVIGDKLIPLIAFIERYIRFRFGLSLFCVARLKE
ncbi:MAG: bifunctional glycosyltransferase/class I SAM-dependent methyltransferase [Candidatus Omnitrophica bacterium]|nr:bifunctional glycosyltransferase/class I SAM-dependent methyltransferase [Candidatus Omnitrophota bacterium]